MRIKKLILSLAICLTVILITALLYRYYDNRNVVFRADGSKFQIYKNGEWHDFLIKGMNMGAGKPGGFPGEMMIGKDEYARWFKQIAEMNVNIVRVYTILSPDFYEALYEYNMFSEKPIYIFHGAWINEEAMAEHNNAYAPEITGGFENEIRNLIDLLHGNAVISPKTGHASGTYRWDVSPYVAGYILGIELDANFVINTNEKNADIKNFDGDYLYSESASPHECWLARMGDLAISYETQKYKAQKPVSWSNWLTTDPLTHTNEPSQDAEDAVSVDIEHIRAKDTYSAGVFASYHIYPYHPEFMMYQPEYAVYTDENGNPNPYKAYLMDLQAHHSVPLVVAEFGIPTSRGCCHENIISGYNQGFMTERQQGEYVAEMFDSITSADCAGGIVFTWQDEWFKRSWNNMDYDDPERRAYWSNYQTAEQHYGILSFDPGKKRSVSYADGDISEWDGIKPVCLNGDVSLSVLSDAKFVYFMIQDSASNAGESQYIIGIDSIGGQGNFAYDGMGISFANAADTIIMIDGQSNSRVMTDAYYDIWYRMYSILGVVERNALYEQKNSGIFNPINLLLRNKLTLPLSGEEFPQSSYETGKLLHGSANPKSPDYNSLADFTMNPDTGSIEIRVPWQLLNIADPSSKKAIGDLYRYDYFNANMTDTDGFALEIIAVENGKERDRTAGRYSWDSWDEPVYHERLKESYYILKEHFAKY